jgi:signal transduction histidine kinase
VLRVLVENGIKAIYPKSGVVRIVSKLESNHLRKYINITVSDTGKGIEDKTKTKLFKQPIPRKAFGEGAGLGLWLSKIIVRSHQGTIELFHTEPEKGSTFQVRLPVLNRVPQSQQPK